MSHKPNTPGELPNDEPSELAFRLPIQVQASDIDALGHANNVVWLRWVNEAAIAHASHVGMGPLACIARDVVWVVRRHDISYILPAFEGEMLEAITWAHSLRGASSLRRTIFKRDGRILARAESTWAMIVLSTGRPTRIPADMLLAYGFGPSV